MLSMSKLHCHTMWWHAAHNCHSRWLLWTHRILAIFTQNIYKHHKILKLRLTSSWICPRLWMKVSWSCLTQWTYSTYLAYISSRMSNKCCRMDRKYWSACVSWIVLLIIWYSSAGSLQKVQENITLHTIKHTCSKHWHTLQNLHNKQEL